MSRTSNDDRSDRFNSNNSAYDAAEANEAAQRGDWDYDDDDGNVRHAVPDAKPIVESLEIGPANQMVDYYSFANCSPPSERRLLSQLVVDRQSHFVNVLMSLVQYCRGHEYETDESRERRLKAIESIERSIQGSGYADVEDLQESDCPDDLRKDLCIWRRELRWVKEGKWDDQYRTPYLNLVPDPEMIVLYDAEIFVEVSGQLLAQLDKHSGRYLVVNLHRREYPNHIPCSKRDPLELDAESFIDQSQAIDCLKKRLEQSDRKGKSYLFCPCLADSKQWTSQHAHRMVDEFKRLIAVYPEWWDITLTLRGLVDATLAAEWAGCGFTVFGIRAIKPRGRYCRDDKYENHDKEDGSIVVSYGVVNATTLSEAKQLYRALRQRGFRSMIVNTPPIDGPVSWARWWRHDVWNAIGTSNDAV